jgi:osmotically-inducible protein OsmY
LADIVEVLQSVLPAIIRQQISSRLLAMRRFKIVVLGLVGMLGLCPTLLAQQRGGSGMSSGSGFGGGAGGMSGISSSGGFNTGAGGFGSMGQTSNSASGAGGMSSGAFGSRNLGGGLSAGQSNFSGANRGKNTVGTPGEVGGLQGNERFTRNGRAAGQFVGADGADTANMIGVMAGAQNAALQGLSRSLNNLNPNQNRQEGNTRAKKTVRAVRSVEFEYRAPQVAVINTNLGTRLTKSKAIAAQGNIGVAMEGRTAVLTGMVANEHARDLAARLCLLEPGVSKVENRLTIPEELTPPSEPAFAPPVPIP